jgi:hypothetical protein
MARAGGVQVGLRLSAHGSMTRSTAQGEPSSAAHRNTRHGVARGHAVMRDGALVSREDVDMVGTRGLQVLVRDPRLPAGASSHPSLSLLRSRSRGIELRR